ncbi:MAG: carbamoyl phosphate synthase large subunit [Deltaproteobacteria bacterium RBG_16_71_12]|nr:MAG: carbamoyl phosphate synthase large subunit [Deltaproteobacteria bacterium RBG_16_71_12]
MIRPSFTLGGTGGGIAKTDVEFLQLAQLGLDMSPTSEILVEESLVGWKEFELELMRDQRDNVVVVCSIENLDPMGVHTGDSITVAPVQTLTDREYQRLRDAGIAVLRAVGVETGGSNVQFAVNPQDGRLVVIEMNPRVSRSSALASKATGFPIAKVAALLAVGLTLDEIDNDITKKTKAAFEPSIDYVVVKHPRFDFEKFKGAERRLTTQMKSVGEAMAIGRTFQEAFGKALRSLELGVAGLEHDGITKAGGEPLPPTLPRDAVLERLAIPSPERPWLVAEALRRGAKPDQVARATGIDPWFIAQINGVVEETERLRGKKLADLDDDALWRLKQMGFSDARIGQLVDAAPLDVRAHRKARGVVPSMKRVDTCAGEFEAHTPYLYSTYERPFEVVEQGAARPRLDDEARATAHQNKIVILGGGPIRIGQGVEFDYCCVQAATALRAARSTDGAPAFETIMVNCNPETVSTDYDTSDRLYFEPLTQEEVLNIVDVEKPRGVIVQFGGQTPLKLSKGLLAAGVNVLGTSPDAIDRAEDRKRSAALVDQLGLRQPPGGTAASKAEAEALATRLGFPVLLRPSYVLGGRAMELVHGMEELRRYLDRAVAASDDRPLLVDRFLDGAIEVDVDVLCDGARVVIGGIMEHIEEAGIHSGDSACVLPPHTLDVPVLDEIGDAARRLALALGVRGLMNAQLAVRRNRVFIIEVNPRASRTVPFVSKATGLPLAKLAARLQCGATLDELERECGPLDRPMTRAGLGHYAVKEAVMPFIKFPGVDTILGPEMRSTGEVMGIADDPESAFYKSQLGASLRLPASGTLFVSIADVDKEAILPAVRRVHEAGFKVIATGGTHTFLAGAGIPSVRVNKVREGSPHVLEEMASGRVALVFNTTVGAASVKDSFSLRREALQRGIAYYTTIAAADAASRAIARVAQGALDVKSLQAHLAHARSGVA